MGHIGVVIYLSFMFLLCYFVPRWSFITLCKRFLAKKCNFSEYGIYGFFFCCYSCRAKKRKKWMLYRVWWKYQTMSKFMFWLENCLLNLIFFSFQALYFCVPFREQLLEYYLSNKNIGDAEENLLTCLVDLFSQVIYLSSVTFFTCSQHKLDVVFIFPFSIQVSFFLSVLCADYG